METLRRRDYSFAAKNHEHKKIIKAVCAEKGITRYFDSMYYAGRQLNINAGIIKMNVEHLNNVKYGHPKGSNDKYVFEYVQTIPEGITVERKKRVSLDKKVYLKRWALLNSQRKFIKMVKDKIESDNQTHLNNLQTYNNLCHQLDILITVK